MSTWFNLINFEPWRWPSLWCSLIELQLDELLKAIDPLDQGSSFCLASHP
jgi:hypothetical protein